MSEKKEISRATGIMGFATTISRITGLARDIVVAGLFGAGFATDAFFMAFTIPNLLRNFFAEGSLTAAFVPTFADVHHRQGAEEAARVARICWTLLLLVMAAVTLLGILASPLIVQMIGGGFGSVTGKLALTNYLNKLMFPYIFFVSLVALLAGILSVLGHYFLPAVSTAFLNIAMIVCAISLRNYFEIPITALAVGVLVGGALQLFLQFPVLRKKNIHLGFDFHFRHPAVLRISRLMLPGLAGVAIYQINVVVSRLLASFLPQGSVSYLYYGQRLFEFPQGIFVVSLAQAVLPAMSRQAAVGDDEGVKQSFRFALSLILIITLPAAIGLMLSAVPIYSVLFMSGAFSYEDVQEAALALVCFAPGLLFVGVSRVAVSTFYASKDTRTPVVISFFTLLVNIVLGLLLMGPLRHAGLALGITLSSVFNALVLIWILQRRVGSLDLRSMASTLGRVVVASAIMGVVVYWILGRGDWSATQSNLIKGSILLGAIVVGTVVYAAGCLLMRVPEAGSVATMLKRKLFRSPA